LKGSWLTTTFRTTKLRVRPAMVATLVALLPLALLVMDAGTGRLGVDPVESLLHRTGWWALACLLATLSLTPIRRITGWNRVVAARKPFGLAAFGYAMLHLVMYVAVDQWFAWSIILQDVLERPYITAGFTALLLLVPLALTSTTESIRRLGGKRWRRIHRLVYPAAGLAVLHFYLSVKADPTQPLLFAGLLALLLLLRLPRPVFARTRPRATRGRDRSRTSALQVDPSPRAPTD